MTRKDYPFLAMIFIVLQVLIYYLSLIFIGDDNEFVIVIVILNIVFLLGEIEGRIKSRETLWMLLSRSTWNKFVFVLALFTFYLWEFLAPTKTLKGIHPILPFVWMILGFALGYLVLFLFVNKNQFKPPASS